jgi:hypothetical protein
MAGESLTNSSLVITVGIFHATWVANVSDEMLPGFTTSPT